MTGQSAPRAPSAASALPRRHLPPSRHPHLAAPYPALGTGFTGPLPTRPASSDWLLQVPVVLSRCRLAGVGGKGRASGSVGRAGTRMCVVAVAEELVSGAQRPMDEEDAAAPVGGDRGRGPGGLGSVSTEPEAGGWGPGKRLRSQGRGLALWSLVFLPGDPPWPSAGPGETGRSHTDGPGPLSPGSRLSDRAVPEVEAGPGAAASRRRQGCGVLGKQMPLGLGANIDLGSSPLAECQGGQS